jgi:transcriptional regulator with XRE-family HTH domain
MEPVGGLGAFGDRIATLRVQRGWTQQDLADRLAMSRTALSHLEAGMRVASERTVVILAGVFRVAPFDLIAGTSYPEAKAERLPVVVALYTEVDLALAVGSAELDVLEMMPVEGPLGAAARRERLAWWEQRLTSLVASGPDRAVDRQLVALRDRARDLASSSVSSPVPG